MTLNHFQVDWQSDQERGDFKSISNKDKAAIPSTPKVVEDKSIKN